MRTTGIVLTAALAAIAATGLVLWRAAIPAEAQLPLRGKAFAAIDAPARPQMHCFGDTLAKARSCVLDKCKTGTLPGEACQITAACERSGWAGYVIVRLRPATFTMTMCGVPSRLSLVFRLKETCRSFSSRGLETCALETVWGPNGIGEPTSLVWSARALTSGRGAWR